MSIADIGLNNYIHCSIELLLEQGAVGASVAPLAASVCRASFYYSAFAA